MMYYGNIKPFSIENGPGVRVSLFVSGCRNHCRGCFSRETWDFNYGKPFDEAAQQEVLERLSPAYCAGLTVLGGEPMEPENQRELLPFLRRVRGRYPEKTIWIYTGFTLEFLQDESAGSSGSLSRCRPILTDNKACGQNRYRADTEVLEELLGQTAVLVDGRFMEEEKSLMLAFRGSSNQRIIDLRQSIAEGTVCLIEEWMRGSR